jgi:hypothetical protein
LTPSQFVLDEILKVICFLFDVKGDNDYLQFQILVEFEHICEKMEMLKFWLKATTCHLGLSPHLCVHDDVMNASGCKCTPMSCQYKVNLGQPKVNLGQNHFWGAQGKLMDN